MARAPVNEPLRKLSGVCIPGCHARQDISISPANGTIQSIGQTTHAISCEDVTMTETTFGQNLLALPTLCHPHVHLDKPYLLTHPKTAHLQPETGSFPEALQITAAAKSLYTRESLLERMNKLVTDSSRAGVTHMRGFVEVDATVGMMALDAALELKDAWQNCMFLQVCAFAQDPVFSGESGDANRGLMEEAVRRSGVSVLGSTPYVESDTDKTRRNIVWAVQTAIRAGVHLDLHLDYNVDDTMQSTVWFVLETLRNEDWVTHAPDKTVCLGHCTRLTLFSHEEWSRLLEGVRSLPVFFVGLPTSDIFMMGRPKAARQTDEINRKLSALLDRGRCTMQVPAMIDAGFDACIGINNIGNTFTPYGNADPLALAGWCVGLYQVGTVEQTEMLYECVSNRAKRAIGVSMSRRSQASRGDAADFLLFGNEQNSGLPNSRLPTRICEVVWDSNVERKLVYRGRWIKA